MCAKCQIDGGKQNRSSAFLFGVFFCFLSCFSRSRAPSIEFFTQVDWRYCNTIWRHFTGCIIASGWLELIDFLFRRMCYVAKLMAAHSCLTLFNPILSWIWKPLRCISDTALQASIAQTLKYSTFWSSQSSLTFLVKCLNKSRVESSIFSSIGRNAFRRLSFDFHCSTSTEASVESCVPRRISPCLKCTG